MTLENRNATYAAETEVHQKENKERLATNPVFVVGVPRSGTTMLYNVVVRHPSFAGRFEPTWNTETSIFKKFIRHTDGFFEKGEWPFWNEYFAGDEVAFREFQRDSIRSFLVNAAIARGANRVLEKTPNHIEKLDDIYDTFPQASVLHIVRHPVDVYASMRKRAKITPIDRDPWLRVDHTEFASGYSEKVSRVSQFEDTNRLLTVRFEDITTSPDIQSQRIFEFLGEQHATEVIEGELPIKTEGKFPIQSNVPTPNSRDWENVVSQDEAEDIQSICLQVMSRYKYEKY